MNQYFEAPKGFNVEDYIPFLRYILSVVMALGGILTVVSIIYLAITMIKAIFGFSKVQGKYLNIAMWGMIIGLILLGGGWIGLIKFFRLSMFPTKFF